MQIDFLRRVRVKRALPIAALVVVMMDTSPVIGDVTVETHQDRRRGSFHYQMTVTPAPKPFPVLKHRLLIPESEKKPGNSVPAFYRAMMKLQLNMRNVYRNFPGPERHYTLMYEDKSSDELPADRMRQVVELAKFEEEVIPGLREAARRTDCVWDRQLHRMRGKELREFLLPDLQESRECNHMLALLEAVQIAEGKFDEALATMRLHFELAVDGGQPPHTIANLVSVAWVNRVHEQLVHFVSADGAPNLFWAIAELPQPLIPLRGAARFEATFYWRAIPLLDNRASHGRSPEDWNRVLADWRVENLQYCESVADEETSEILAALKRLDDSDQESYVYPRAKKRLISSGDVGSEVESMPFAQVIMLDAEFELRQVLQEYEKWVYLPFPAALAEMEAANLKLTDLSDCEDNYGALVGRLHLGIFRGPCLARLRTTRDFASLQVIEALRMHAAEAGRFPERLRDVTCVPVPDNPATGRPFNYRNVDGTAFLDLSLPVGRITRHFELTLKTN